MFIINLVYERENDRHMKMDEESMSKQEDGLLSEKIPLIISGSAVHGGDSVSRTKLDDILSEVKRQLRLALPLVSANLLVFALQVISIMFVGHLGELQLSGASLATSFASVAAFSLLIGLSGGLETLCGQSYGAKDYHMLGIHMQRGIFILVLFSIPLALISAFTQHILVFLGQDPEISIGAGSYACFLIPGIFAYAIFQCQVRFLQAQNNVFPMMFIVGITTLLHIFSCWILVFKSGLGSNGAALASSISNWINSVSLAMYIKFSPSCKLTWGGFSPLAFRDLWKFLRLALPSAVMTCMEIWSFEMMVLLSGLLPNPKLETSVLSISLNTASMIFMLPLGLSGAISTRVSNELGAGRPYAARLASYTGLCVAVSEGILMCTTLILVRNLWGHCYSTEKEVVRYVAQMMFLLAGSHILEGFQSVLSGTVRGCGRQKIGAMINLGAYYLVGIPTGVLLAFVHHMGGKGLWLGIIVALSAQSSFLAILTVKTDWKKEAQKAADRVQDTRITAETS